MYFGITETGKIIPKSLSSNIEVTKKACKKVSWNTNVKMYIVEQRGYYANDRYTSMG